VCGVALGKKHGKDFVYVVSRREEKNSKQLTHPHSNRRIALTYLTGAESKIHHLNSRGFFFSFGIFHSLILGREKSAHTRSVSEAFCTCFSTITGLGLSELFGKCISLQERESSESLYSIQQIPRQEERERDGTRTMT
jgi:hypothetical protein